MNKKSIILGVDTQSPVLYHLYVLLLDTSAATPKRNGSLTNEDNTAVKGTILFIRFQK